LAPRHTCVMKNHFFSIFLIAAVFGCGKAPEDEVVSDAKPPAQKFEGAVDKRFVGTWRTASKKNMIVLTADGSAKMHNEIGTPKGPQIIDVTMQWKVDKNRIAFQKQDDQSVQSYGVELQGDTLNLKTSKSSTAYFKQK
jgi:hypothetical protein